MDAAIQAPGPSFRAFCTGGRYFSGRPERNVRQWMRPSKHGPSFSTSVGRTSGLRGTCVYVASVETRPSVCKAVLGQCFDGKLSSICCSCASKECNYPAVVRTCPCICHCNCPCIVYSCTVFLYSSMHLRTCLSIYLVSLILFCLVLSYPSTVSCLVFLTHLSY